MTATPRTGLSSNNTLLISSAPYYDDYNTGDTRSYSHILFKPGAPVQARELNQIQSNLHETQKKFLDFVFVEGSEMYPCKENINDANTGYTYKIYSDIHNTDTEIKYVKLEATANAQQFVDSKAYQYDGDGAITARLNVLCVIDAGVLSQSSLPTLIGELETGSFVGSTVTYNTANGYSCSTTSSVSTGNSSVLYIEDSKWFIRGSALDCNSQYIAISPYDGKPTKRLGLTIDETIITSNEDSSLLDNASGTFNYTAPGADRYQKKLILDTKELTTGTSANVANVAEYNDITTPNFFEFARLNAGELYIENRRPVPHINQVFKQNQAVFDMDFINNKLQLRRMNNTELLSEVGSNGEVIYNTTLKTLHAMDGVTAYGNCSSLTGMTLYTSSGGAGLPSHAGTFQSGDYYLDYTHLKNKPVSNSNFTVSGLDYRTNFHLRIRQQTEAELTSYSGVSAELVHNTTNNFVHIMDGSTLGGFSRCINAYSLHVVSGNGLNGSNTVAADSFCTGDDFLDYNKLKNKPVIPDSLGVINVDTPGINDLIDSKLLDYMKVGYRSEWLPSTVFTKLKANLSQNQLTYDYFNELNSYTHVETSPLSNIYGGFNPIPSIDLYPAAKNNNDEYIMGTQTIFIPNSIIDTSKPIYIQIYFSPLNEPGDPAVSINTNNAQTFANYVNGTMAFAINARYIKQNTTVFPRTVTYTTYHAGLTFTSQSYSGLRSMTKTSPVNIQPLLKDISEVANSYSINDPIYIKIINMNKDWAMAKSLTGANSMFPHGMFAMFHGARIFYKEKSQDETSLTIIDSV